MNKEYLGGTILWLLLWWPPAVLGQPNAYPLARPKPTSVDVEYERHHLLYHTEAGMFRAVV